MSTHLRGLRLDELDAWIRLVWLPAKLLWSRPTRAAKPYEFMRIQPAIPHSRTSGVKFTLLAIAIAASLILPGFARDAARIPETARNLLVEAEVSGNLESFNKGLRGAARDMIFDHQKGAFVRPSQWHEYGIGFNEDLGVVTENRPAWWMAQWAAPIQANLILLSGTYENQPQRNTAWKIELRRDGQWTTHARGAGGWYDRGYYTWGGPGREPLTFDGLRVSVFSPDNETPIKSIHFRGEARKSWIVAFCPPIDAKIVLPSWPLRATAPASFSAEPLLGEIQSWSWNFGDGKQVEGRTVSHAFTRTGEVEVALQFSDGTHTDRLRRMVTVLPPVEARITPLTKAVMAGRSARFGAEGSIGKIADYKWDFGDGAEATGARQEHTFARPGIYKVKLTVTDGTYEDDCLALVRVHTDRTVRLPQLLLDTDAKNEQDDQHYIGYALFSELDILGINSVHHGGGQEAVNYAEILHVIDLSRQSGLARNRVPFVFRGADKRLTIPESGRWHDTEPILTDASEAILAVARGASPDNPVWIVPVGPGTNPASAILQARREGFELKDRIRIIWLGGSNNEITNEFNGNNDPWSMYVVSHSGIETWIMPAPVGARVAIDKTKEGHLYADNPLGRYLKSIVPARNKALYDASCLSAIISKHLDLGWVKQSDPVVVGGPKEGYRWTRTDQPTSVRVIRQIDEKAMQLDLFNTMKGKPVGLESLN
jgi:chitodextrinase